MKTLLLDAGARAARRASLPAAAAAIALGLLLAPSSANAQSKEELDKARATFREGLALSAANNCSGALVKFKAVAAVKMTPQVAFNIAECEEKLGKLVSALGNYRLAESAAAGDPKIKDLAAQAGSRATAIEERIPKLTVTRGKGAEAAQLELDGVELSRSQIGTPVTVDPGPHLLIGRIGDREASRQTVDIEEKESKTVEVVITEAEKPADDKPKLDDKPQLPVEPTQPASRGPSIPGIVLTGVGVAGIAAGLVLFFGPRQSTIDELDTLCGGDNTCPPSAKATADQGRLYTGIAEAAAGVGIASLVTGVILIATNPSKPASTPKAQSGVRFIGAAPGATLGGVSLTGRF
ncbi:hypothetical protein [Polyangium aurulentum]|uniref:hypothetical protein n=1 Tax=Polyangium aurulentum TaxID=2567896 RepID=UPI0010ADEB1D|nr:hypothetical protein [Polyangium aurulentum]UQA57332.1 hypothetical protein E8A73_039550 [Polyangium aurulentum]